MILLVAAKVAFERTIKSLRNKVEQLTRQLAEKDESESKSKGNQFLASNEWI